MNKLYRLSMLVVLLLSTTLLAQRYTVSGVVKSAGGENLIGANVFVEGTTSGAATDENGKYEITLAAGRYTVVCSYIGFETVKENINLTNNMVLDFSLRDRAFSLSVEVIADRAKERETPVAFTTVEKKEMEQKLGSQDIPMVLNTTPSIYASQDAGASGDSRVSLRGFSQRNFAIMINGVPVNDMENGLLYWSNWDGVGDATSSIQIQRGLSAVNLATPSIGGTLNIVTDPVGFASSFDVKQEYGSGDFYKTTLSFNSGLIDDKFALNGTFVRKFGDGILDRTWTDAWAFYVGAAYNINEKNRIELYALGAPQMHGQYSYEQNMAELSHELAIDNGYSAEALAAFPENGRKWNGMANVIDPSYNGRVAYNDNWFTTATGLHNRHAKDFLNERENFFHKPIVNLNYYSQLTDKASLYTTFYYSGGLGGGSGTYGKTKSVKMGATSVKDWNAMILNNRAETDDEGYYISKGTMRSSRNDQNSWGALAKVIYKATQNLSLQVGVDWRTADIDHYREVRDLLGGDYIIVNDNELAAANQKARLGDKIDYWETNTVDWIGAYLQGEYTMDRFTAVATGGWTMVKYSSTNHFLDDGTGKAKYIETDNLSVMQVKGGVSYRISQDMDAFVNAGWVNKVPTLDQALNDVYTVLIPDPENETFMDVEAGLNWHGLDGRLVLQGNIYYTSWINRYYSQARGDNNIYLNDLDETHMGFELEAAYQPIDLVRFDLALSVGDWKYASKNVESTITDWDAGTQTTSTVYLDGIKVGDQPQQSVVLTASFFPIEGLYVSAIGRYYREYYAEIDLTTRNVATDNTQSWQVPDFFVMDAHIAYDLPWKLGSTGFQVFGHVFNVLDELYISEATDNSQYESYQVNKQIVDPHGASAASVYLGLPINFNAGIKIRF